MPANIKDLFEVFPRIGKLDYISIRPARNEAVSSLSEVKVELDGGLAGDHYSGQNGKRHVTLLQAEHLPVIASFMGWPSLDPALTRRNLVVSGLNLLALKGQTVQIGDEVQLEYTGECYPCSKMETAFGAGGYNALRGHGGITARVIRGGVIRVGDAVRVV
ncbi:MOSC domain-containing protein [Fibrella sp. HMF5335]|uniref:MOSC domain-containing protein n=1 Tax=Fibrella rubiginis TaxID=2817060 RepID=A0A939K6N2_9BACT|nr:MOSC domain-containing protein [Fibrella rubiginis]MBO0939023.1 MOSC domain-containing protein [Fibrella rubiginis]